MLKLTIHTATFNRAYILEKAYLSLKAQTNKDFEWIITDDGSEDETETLIQFWKEQNAGFPIVYNKLEHVGIPRALNAGVQKARTSWFMMLDSDDYLLPETVEKVLQWVEEIEDKQDFVGIGYARMFPNGDYMKPQCPLIDSSIGFVDATNIERKKYNLDMDMVEVYRVALLKRYPFQYWPTEKYAPEQLGFNEMSFDGYKIRWHADKLYVCEYLDDGQTKDDRLVMNNPMGFAMMYNQNMRIHSSLKEKCYDAIQMIALALYGKNPKYLIHSNEKWITLLLMPIGGLLFLRRAHQYRLLQEKSNYQ